MVERDGMYILIACCEVAGAAGLTVLRNHLS